ncbi:MAG: AraC family transcriptional regulator [Clostridia bacterium]|nr:AraC family transcriptional regulator [Clostridia bacterium]
MKQFETFFSARDFKDILPYYCGHCENTPDQAHGPRIRPYYVIHYVEKGSGFYKTPQGEFKVNAGDIFIIKPGDCTFYHANPEDPWVYTWVSFTGEKSNELKSLPYVLSVKCKSFLRLSSFKQPQFINSEFTISVLYELFSEILHSSPHSKDYVENVKGYIDNAYMTDISVEQIAESVGLDRRYLSRIFKKAIGTTIKEYLVTIRLKKAAEFLKQGYSVTVSANMAGYNDIFNFSKMFKKYYGVSPKNFNGDNLNNGND